MKRQKVVSIDNLPISVGAALRLVFYMAVAQTVWNIPAWLLGALWLLVTLLAIGILVAQFKQEPVTLFDNEP